MITPFSNITHSTLLDMLVKQTALYTQLLAENIKTTEFYKCRRMVEQLTSEIGLRKDSTLAADLKTGNSVSMDQD